MKTPCAIGIDVGGSKTAGAVVTLDGRPLAPRVAPTRPERGGRAVLDAALAMAEALAADARRQDFDVAAVGIAVAELVDVSGNVVSENLIAWRGMPVQSLFSKIAPARVDADVRCAALGEARFGAGRGRSVFLYVTVGTGISSALVLGGRPYTGARGCTGTCASSPVGSDPPLEKVAAGPAILARYNELSKTPLARGEEITAAAARGDLVAIRVVSIAGEALGGGIGWLVNVLDPEAVVIGGGLGVERSLFWDCAVASARLHIWSDLSRALPIVPAALGTNAAVVGAAAGALEARGIL